jgi:hypothetical protein
VKKSGTETFPAGIPHMDGGAGGAINIRKALLKNPASTVPRKTGDALRSTNCSIRLSRDGTNNMLPDMYRKDTVIAAVAEKALVDNSLFQEIVDGLQDRDETFRYNCSKVLTDICREHAELLYPHWDYLVGLLDSPNSYHIMSSLYFLACLAGVDKDNRSDGILDKYFSKLNDKGSILAIYTAQYAGKIAAAKPHLRKKITDTLLDIDNIYPGKQPELVKGAVITAFNEYFGDAEDKEVILNFVRNQSNSDSPKTKKAAKAFLDKWE